MKIVKNASKRTFSAEVISGSSQFHTCTVIGPVLNGHGQIVDLELTWKDKLSSLEKEISTLRDRNNYFQQRSRKNRKEKLRIIEFKRTQISKIRARAKINLTSAETKCTKRSLEAIRLKKGLLKIFTAKQISMLVEGKHHLKWSNEEILKGITLRYRANTYDALRAMNFPFPATRTLQAHTQKIDFKPGILFPIINLMKNYFEGASDFQKQCCLVFDEMALDGSYSYDDVEDKVYAPKVNFNVYFLRGLLNEWKQPIAYEFDDDFSVEKVMYMIQIVQQNAGLKVRCVVSDLGELSNW